MLNLFAYIADGFANLAHSKLRSLLALLGVLVGTASVVAMVLGGELATSEALKQFKSLGTDLLAMDIRRSMDGKSDSDKNETINLQAALNLQKSHPDILQAAPYTQLYQRSYYGGESIPATVVGATENLAQVIHIPLLKGRFVSILDGYQFYCVVGQKIYQRMQKILYQDPLGKQIQIGKNIFTVIGVADYWPENSFIYTNIDNAIIVPILSSTIISKYAVINDLVLQLKPNANIVAIESALSHQVQKETDNLQINYRSAKELIARMEKQNDILTVFLGLIGSVSLIVGGIGVMNIMLVSVIERRREIGIRLAVGAKPRDITLLFLSEAIMLSLFGGAIGVLLGIIIAYGIAYWWHWQFTFFLGPPLIGFSVSVFVGIFFGFYPAFKAAKLNPIDALRSD